MCVFMSAWRERSCIAMLPSLGSVEQEEVWNEAAAGLYEYTKGDQSILILLYGVASTPASHS